MAMQLCLVHNDPIATLLVTQDGEPLYSIETPSSTYVSDAKISTSPPIQNTPSPSVDIQPTTYNASKAAAITVVKRLERYHSTTGHVETQIALIEYQGERLGTRLRLCSSNNELSVSPIQGHGQNQPPVENSWEFTSPDGDHYKWQMFVKSPILMLNDNSHTPLARYRRAKLGIVSRSRRAFLEILPAGLNVIDLIVVTFVTFMKQRVLLVGDSSE